MILSRSAYDADSEGIEGKILCWKYDEIEKLLKKNLNNSKKIS